MLICRRHMAPMQTVKNPSWAHYSDTTEYNIPRYIAICPMRDKDSSCGWTVYNADMERVKMLLGSDSAIYLPIYLLV